MSKLSVRDLPLTGKRVLIRVDFNVPLDSRGFITDDTRLQASIPTIRYVLEHGGKPILMSHLGRPKGQPKAEFSLKPCAHRLAELLGIHVAMAPDSVGPEVEKLSRTLQANEILLLENLRFHPGEEDCDKEPNFVSELALLGDCYVNDAFGTAHRAHASTYYLARQFPHLAAAGLLLEKEIAYLGEALVHPKHPFVAVIGGSKVSSKLGVLKSLVNKVDTLMVGGAMAFTFLKADGVEVGDSLVEDELLDATRELRGMGAQIWLPKDVVIVQEMHNESPQQIVSIVEGIPPGWRGVDVGPVTLKEWQPLILSAQTVFWNGPLGVFEMPNFAKGTFQMAHLIAHAEGVTVVGGGDSIAAVNQAQVGNAISHLSTGGGAALELIEHGTLPGLEVLTEK